MNLQPYIEHFITDYCQSTTRVVVALSGGVDSVVLLDLLVRSTLSLNQLNVVHVHHGLNRDADEWVVFCRELCRRYQVEFSVEHVELSDDGRNIEAAARNARYQALARYISDNDILVTAQHADDQAETLLLALKRGSGALGLAAMPLSLRFASGRHNRPLLDVARADIEAYAQVRKLSWIEDDSNKDSRFDRNYLRNEILPQLNQRWQGFSRSVARSANLLGQSIELLDELAVIDYAKALCVTDNIVSHKMLGQPLSIDVVCGLSFARQNNLIRYWLRQHQLAMPSQAQLQQIMDQILDGAIDSDPIVSFSAPQSALAQLGSAQGSAEQSSCYHVRRYRGAMMVVPPQRDISQEVVRWRGTNCIMLPDQVGTVEFSLNDHGFDQEHQLCLIAPAQQQVEIRFSVAGSYKAWPVGRNKRRSVKKLWQEYAVPTWLRGRIPLVFFDDRLVAALGIWVEQGFKGTAAAPNLTLIWRQPT